MQGITPVQSRHEGRAKRCRIYLNYSKDYYYDSDLKWYWLSTRYYDPEIGRFISPDNPQVLLENRDSIYDKNPYVYCDNNPISRADEDGELWHIVVGAAIGAAISGGIQIASNLLSGQKWSKGLGTAVISGGASGALAASGAGLVGCIAGNAAISMGGNAANQVTQNKGFSNFSARDMMIDGMIGAVAGAAGGRGMGKFVNLKTLNKNFTRKVFSGSFKTASKGFKYYSSQTKTLYKRYFFQSIKRSCRVSVIGSAIKALCWR